MEQQKKPTIHERSDKELVRLMLIGLAISLAGAVYFYTCSGSALNAAFVTIGRVLAAVMCVICLAGLVRGLMVRVDMDENGVETDIVTGGHVHLRWQDLKTAAVVWYSVGDSKSNTPIILLARIEPEQVLTREAFENGKNKREQVRIRWTQARQDCAEHYLRMKLPEIRL